MKFDIYKKFTNIRILYVFFSALTGWCLVSSVYASELDGSPYKQTQNVDKYEQIRKYALIGSSAAQFELGLMFEYGRGVDQDDLVAAFWYEKSAAQGNSSAQYRLAVLFDNGWGHPIDKENAFLLYKSAAERGHELAQHDLAIMYFQGTGVVRDLVQAYKWLNIAHLNGNPLMQKHMDMVSKEMSSDEIRVAEYIARRWVEHSGI